MRSLIFTIVLFLQLHCVIAQEVHPIIFDNIKINESCLGQAIRKKIILNYYDDEPVAITYLGSNLSSAKLKYANKEIKKNSSFILEKPIDFENIFIEFFIEELNELPAIYINQKIGQLSKTDTITIFTGHFFISTKDSEIVISDACIDTITIILPVIATQTDVTFFKFIDGEYVEQFYTYYYDGFGGNQIRLPKNTFNKYKIGITGCHTPYFEFEFELK